MPVKPNSGGSLSTCFAALKCANPANKTIPPDTFAMLCALANTSDVDQILKA